MGASLHSREQLAGHVLLAMDGYSLKRLVCGLVGVLDDFSGDAGHGQLAPHEVARIRRRIDEMRQSAGAMLSNVDELIGELQQACPALEQFGALLQSCEMEDETEHIETFATSREQWADDVSGLPPHLWNM